MHHEARITFDFGHVAPVVVDAMPVERERRIAKQQHVVGSNLALPQRALRCRLGRRLRIAWTLRFAVRDVVELDDRRIGCAVATQLMAHLHEHECAAATLLERHVVDRRQALDLIAHPQRRTEFELAARPHAARQRHQWHEAAALGVAVRADL